MALEVLAKSNSKLVDDCTRTRKYSHNLLMPSVIDKQYYRDQSFKFHISIIWDS